MRLGPDIAFGEAQVALDGHGNAVAVWSGYSGGTGKYYIHASRYSAVTAAWEPAGLLNTDGYDGVNASVAMDPEGNALVAFEQKSFPIGNVYTPTDIYFCRFSVASREWSTPAPLEVMAGKAFSPQVGMDPSGNAMVVWYQEDGALDNYKIFASRFLKASASWSPPNLVEPANHRRAEFPYVVLDGSGNALTVWRMLKPGSDKESVFASRFSVARNGWSPSVRLDSFEESLVVTHVASNALGQAIAIWDRFFDAGHRYIYASHFTPESEVWGPPVRLDRGTTSESDSARIGMDQAGNALAVWRQRDGTANAIMSSRFAVATGQWEAPTTLGGSDPREPWPNGSVNTPWVVMNPAGMALAAWNRAGSPYRVLASAFSGGAWADPQSLETNGGNDYFPHLSTDATGNIVAVWTRLDGAGFSIYASWFK